MSEAGRRTPSKSRRTGPAPTSGSQNHPVAELYAQKIFFKGPTSWLGYIIDIKHRLGHILVGFPDEETGELTGEGYLFKSVDSYLTRDLRQADEHPFVPGNYRLPTSSETLTSFLPAGLGTSGFNPVGEAMSGVAELVPQNLSYPSDKQTTRYGAAIRATSRFKLKNTITLPVQSTLEIHYRHNIPTIDVCVIQICRNGTDQKLWKASFTAKTGKIDDVRVTLKHALLYNALVKLHVGRGGYNLPLEMHRFENSHLHQMALCAGTNMKNTAQCLTAINSSAWPSVKVGASHVYRFVTKNLNTNLKRYLPHLFEEEKLDKSIRLSNLRARRKDIKNNSEKINTSNNRGGKTSTMKEMAVNNAMIQAQKSIMKSVFVERGTKNSTSNKSNTFEGNSNNSSSSTSSNNDTNNSSSSNTNTKKHSVRDDEFLSDDNLYLLFGSRLKGVPGFTKAIEKQVNSKEVHEIFEIAGVESPNFGDHVAYYLAKAIIAPLVAVEGRLNKEKKINPVDQMVETLLATTDPTGALRKMEKSPLKVLLVTLALVRFDATHSIKGVNEKNKARGAFKTHRSKSVKALDKKATKILTVINILVNLMDPKNNVVDLNSPDRNLLSLSLELDAADAGISNENNHLLNIRGLVAGKDHIERTMQILAEHISLYWAWEVEAHTNPVTGVIEDDGSRAHTISHADNVDIQATRGNAENKGNDIHMIGIGATKLSGRRRTKKEIELIDQGVTSRDGTNNTSDTSTPRADDWKQIKMSNCEKKEIAEHHNRRLLLFLHQAALDNFDAGGTAILLWKAGDAVDLLLKGSNHRTQGIIDRWNISTSTYTATYTYGSKAPITADFKVHRVFKFSGNAENPVAVDNEEKTEHEDEEEEEEDVVMAESGGEQNDTRSRIFNEPLVDASETLIIKVMPECSSKHFEAAAQMELAMREALQKHNFLANPNGVVFVIEDFEFFKSLIEKYLINPDVTTVPVPAFGHLGKAIAVQILSYYEAVTTTPLLIARGVAYMSSKMRSLLKGVHIGQTVSEALRHGVVAGLALSSKFIEKEGDIVMDEPSQTTVHQYLSNPECLMDDSTTTIDYVLDAGGRPIPYPKDKYGDRVVKLFKDFICKEMKNVDADADAGADGAPDLANPASISPLEISIMYVLTAIEVKKRCREHAIACEEFEWLAYKNNSHVLRARLLEFERNGSDSAAAEKSNLITSAVISEEIEGPELPVEANMNLCVLHQLVMVDTANLSLLQLATRVVPDPLPTIIIDETCDCCYAHDRCFRQYRWWLAVKASLQTVFAHRQYNYQLSLIYFALQIVGFTNNSNHQFVSLVLETITKAAAQSAWGHALRASPIDLEQERDIVLRIKEQFRRNRSKTNLVETRARLYSMKLILARRETLKKKKKAGETLQLVSNEKKKKWENERRHLCSELAVMKALVKEIFEKQLAVTVGTGANFVDTKKLCNILYTADRQQLLATQSVCRAMEQGMTTKLPKDQRIPPRTVGVPVPSKDKKKAADKKDRERAKREERARVIALEVASNLKIVVPDDITMLTETPTSSTKASLVIEICRQLLLGSRNGNVNSNHANKMLAIFNRRNDMWKFMSTFDVNHRQDTSYRLSRSRRSAGGFIKLVDVLQELQLCPSLRKRLDGTEVKASYRELARAILIQCTRRHFTPATQGVILNMDTAQFITPLRQIVQNKRGKSQEAILQQRAMYETPKPDDPFDTTGTWTEQMKRKYGFVEFIAHLIVLEMNHVDVADAWDFHRIIQEHAGSTHGFVVFIGGADVVEVATGKIQMLNPNDYSDDVQIQLFPDTASISSSDLIKLFRNVPKQAEGERMNTTCIWLLVLYGISALKSNKTLIANLLIISNDADTVDAHAMPLIHALITMIEKYLPGKTKIQVLLEVKPKSTAVLTSIGALAAQRQANGGGGGEVGAIPSGRQLFTIIDLVSMYHAIESFDQLPDYNGAGLRAVAFTSGIFLIGGSDYVSPLYKLNYKKLIQTMKSSQYKAYVLQVIAAGGNVSLFDIIPAVDQTRGIKELNLVNFPDPDGTLAPKFNANAEGRNLLQIATAILEKKTLRLLKQVYGEDAMNKLKKAINIDIILAGAKVAGVRVYPLNEAAMLTRRAEENAVANQFGSYQFQAFPGENDDPMCDSPFYYDAFGNIQRRPRPNPRLGTATMITPEARAIGHFGAALYNHPPVSNEMKKFWPLRDFQVVIKDAMKSSSGTEAPRTVNTERLQPTRAASTLAEVSAFQNGVGKFADTTNSFEQLKKVIDNSVINATSYSRLSKKTKLFDIVSDKKRRKYNSEIGIKVLPSAVFTRVKEDYTSQLDFLKKTTLTYVLEKVKDGNVDFKTILFLVLEHIVGEFEQERVTGDDDDDDDDDDEENEAEEEAGGEVDPTHAGFA